MINSYEIRLYNGAGQQFGTLYDNGTSAMEATETAVQNTGTQISPAHPVTVVAINVTTGLSFKFEMAKTMQR